MTENITLRAKQAATRKERPQKPISASYSPTGPSTYPTTATTLTGLTDAEIKQEQGWKREHVVARLSPQFRVIAEGGTDPRQWILQRRYSAKGGDGWTPISFCQSRDGLLLSIREKCIDASVAYRRSRPGEVIRADYPGIDAEAMTIIKALPDRFPRKASRS